MIEPGPERLELALQKFSKISYETHAYTKLNQLVQF
jgi:hypothetical protein